MKINFNKKWIWYLLLTLILSILAFGAVYLLLTNNFLSYENHYLHSYTIIISAAILTLIGISYIVTAFNLIRQVKSDCLCLIDENGIRNTIDGIFVYAFKINRIPWTAVKAFSKSPVENAVKVKIDRKHINEIDASEFAKIILLIFGYTFDGNVADCDADYILSLCHKYKGNTQTN